MQEIFFKILLQANISLISKALLRNRSNSRKNTISKSFACFSDKIGDWSGNRQKLAQNFLEALDLSDYLLVLP